jgi:ArsR family transcriptional regulator, arsenate/arsenite/antimonite-responsive transcriptional repressor
MAYSKASHFDPRLFSQSIWSKALSHPARIIILRHLLEHGVTPFYVFTKKIPLAKATISQHLRMLKNTGLIQSYEQYPYTYYLLNHTACKELALRIKSLNKSFISA